MSEIAKLIGQRIRNHRSQQGLSQEKLAELAGCHPTYIGQLERGEKNATIESIEKIAVALNISLSALFENLKSNGMKIYGSVPDSSALKITDIDKNSGVVCVIGNEGNGISDEVKNNSQLVTSPMNGYAESLNAAAAATIIMWEMMR